MVIPRFFSSSRRSHSIAVRARMKASAVVDVTGGTQDIIFSHHRTKERFQHWKTRRKHSAPNQSVVFSGGFLFLP